jgi:hypothetical protein
LKLKGTSTWSHNSTYLSHYDEGTLSSSLLWHARFRHINYDSLCKLKKNGVFGLPTIPTNLKQCEACILGKHKQAIHVSTSRESKNLELIHFDLCGPMHVASNFGNKYIMNFIGNYTRMCCVYLLEHKSQAFETFKKFHVWIENETQSNINMLHNDNVGEYTSNEFENYLHQHGINQTTIPYNPQENGVEERMNMTVLNMVCPMLFFKNVKFMSWADVVLCVVYVRNNSPSHALGTRLFLKCGIVAFLR